MSTPTILDFYRANVGHPDAVPYRKVIRWSSSSSPVLTIQPASTEMIMVREVGFWLDSSFNMSSHRRIRIIADEDNEPPTGGINLILNNENDLMAAFDQRTLHRVNTVTAGSICFNPPVKLVGNTQDLTIRYENSSSTPDTGGLHGGNARLVVAGWALAISDF